MTPFIASSQPFCSEAGLRWSAGALASRCQAEIRHFAANSNLPDAHPFNPHVTLLGLDTQPLDSVLETTSQLAAKLAPFTISFDRVSFGKIFHQCVYILCNETPELMQAGAPAREAFGMDPAAKCMPHL